MTTRTIEKAKEELKKQLSELEELETKVKSKKQSVQFEKMDMPFKIGSCYFIRTVTYFATGRVKAIVGNFLVLEDAAWIADTGRFKEAIMEGKLSEVEPVEVNMYLNVNSITDAFDWGHKLPRSQK